LVGEDTPKEKHPLNVVKHIANRVSKYIGMDVHRDRTTVVDLDPQGRVLMEVTLKTEVTGAPRSSAPFGKVRFLFLPMSVRSRLPPY
jgi:hypothetical protein